MILTWKNGTGWRNVKQQLRNIRLRMPNNVRIDIDGNNKGAVRAINGVDRELLQSQKRVDDTHDQYRRSFRGMSQVTEQFRDRMKFAVTAAAGALAFMTKRTIDQADELNKTSERLGIATEELSAFHFAAQQSGLSTKTFDMALQRLTRRASEAAEGSGAAVDAFNQMGISLRDREGQLKNSGDLLYEIANGLKNVESESQRTKLAFKFFDSEGVKLVNMLDDGAVGLEKFKTRAKELGLVIDKETAESAEAFNDSMNELNGHLKGLLVEATSGFIPMLRTIANLMASIPQDVFRVAAEVGSMAAAVYGVNKALRIMIRLISLSRTALIKTGWGALAVVAGTLAAEIIGASEATKGLTGEQDAELETVRSLIKSNETLTKQQREQAKATITQNMAKQQGKISEIMGGIDDKIKDIVESGWVQLNGKLQELDPSKPKEYKEKLALIRKELIKSNPELKIANEQYDKMQKLLAKINDMPDTKGGGGLKALKKKWKSVSETLQNDIINDGLNAQQEQIAQIIQKTQSLKDKYGEIPGAVQEVTDWQKTMLGQVTEDIVVGVKTEPEAIKKIHETFSSLQEKFAGNKKILEELQRLQDKALAKAEKINETSSEIQTPQTLDPTGSMEEDYDEFFDKQLQNAAKLTAQEKWMWASRQQFAVEAMGNMSNAFLQLANMQDKTNKSLFAAHKAFAIAEATIDTYQAAEKAVAELPPPFGEIVAATRIATGLARVATIASTQPGQSATGGGASAPPAPPSSRQTNQTTNNNVNNQQRSVTININGDVVDPDQYFRKNADSIKKLIRDNAVDFGDGT